MMDPTNEEVMEQVFNKVNVETRTILLCFQNKIHVV
jgi:hypothetical protein